MVPERFIEKDARYAQSAQAIAGTWEALGEGAPALVALAQLCSLALIEGSGERVTLDELKPEAKALLYATRNRGVLEVKGTNIAFEAPDRFLAVYVETGPEEKLGFRSRENPEFTVRFFEGLRQLCATGLVLHHIYRDFSLSAYGFEMARQIDHDEVAELLQQAQLA